MKTQDCMINIGANTGLYVILAKLSNPESRIYAFEPSELNCSKLKKNLQANSIECTEVNRIYLFNVALSNFKSDLCPLYLDRKNPNADSHFTLINDHKKTKVTEIIKVNLMDNVLPSPATFTSETFIIIDAEGSEENIIQGWKNLKYMPVGLTLMCEVTSSNKGVLQTLKSFGFEKINVFSSNASDNHLTGNIILRKVR